MAVTAREFQRSGRPIEARIHTRPAFARRKQRRPAELMQLAIGDLAMTSGALVVHGKGNKVRFAYVPESGRPLLAASVSRRGAEVGSLFFRCRRRGGWRG